MPDYPQLYPGESVEGVAGAWETIDSINQLGTMADQDNPPPGPPPGLFSSSRTDSINSTTVFVNPNLIQPANVHHYSGASIQAVRQISGHNANSGGIQLHNLSGHHGQQQPSGHSAVVEVVQEPAGSAEDMLIDDIRHGRRRLSMTESGDVVIEDSTHNADAYSEIAAEENSNCSSSFKQEHQQQQQGLQHPKIENPWQNLGGQARVMNTGQHPSPTGLEVCSSDWPGDFHFEVKFLKPSNSVKNKQWEFSSKLNKLYADMNKWVQVEFRIGHNPPPNLCIRTLPVFSEASHARETVKRCPNHASLEDPSNNTFLYPQHIIRYQNEDTNYEEDSDSGRLSTLFPVGNPHQGTDVCTRTLKFMCLGSDIGGINRRAVRIIFTLELEGNVVGRKVVDVRICSCPKRDLQQEETRLHAREDQCKQIAQRFSTTVRVPQPTVPVSLQPPPGKKRRMEKEQIIMVPVHADDFKKLNEFAESAWVMRDKDNEAGIKETRRRLLQKHNQELIKKMDNHK